MNKNLPIKIVLPRKDDIKPIYGRGGPKKFFGDYNLEVQNKIINCFNDIGDYYAPFFKETKNLIPAVAMLIMKEEACAKSHYLRIIIFLVLKILINFIFKCQSLL